VKPSLSKPESQNKKFNRCTLNVRDLPLERFRLQRDGQKWKQAARSRFDLLLKLSTYANPDGTFVSEDGKKNFSPSARTLLRHYAKRSLYRLTNDLCRLGLLSWEREKNHYGRRTYRIDVRPEKQVPHSQDQVPYSQKTGATTAPDNRCHYDACYQMPDSLELTQNRGLAPPGPGGLRLLEPLPSSRKGAAVLDHHHPEPKSDDDDCGNRRQLRHLKATAILRFTEKHPELDLKLVEECATEIEERALAKGTTIMSAEYFETGLENEAKKMQASESPRSANAWKNFIECETEMSYWAEKLTQSGAVSAENAKAKVREFVNEKGTFDTLEKCLRFFALIHTNVFPDTPEPRENGEKIYFPKTVRKMIELAVYYAPLNSSAANIIINSILNYLHRFGEFKSAERRRQWENLIASQHERKRGDDRRWRYRKKENRQRRVLRAKRKVAKRPE
jgi:hypothetical protein